MVDRGNPILGILADGNVTSPGEVFQERGEAIPPKGAVGRAAVRVRNLGRKEVAAGVAPGVTALPKEFTKLANKLNSIQFKFDPEKMELALDAIEGKSQNSADDPQFDNLRTQFLISENSEPLPAAETRTLVDALRRIKTRVDFKPDEISELISAHNTLFEDGGDQALSSGEAFIQRLADISRETNLIAFNMQAMAASFKILAEYLKTLKDL